MKTVEITRHKQVVSGGKPESTFKVFADIYSKEGIKGINKGVNAVAVRQATNWGSRFGFARLAENGIRKLRGISEDKPLSAPEKIAASTVGGALATWNQPIEVVRVEVSSRRVGVHRQKSRQSIGPWHTPGRTRWHFSPSAPDRPSAGPQALSSSPQAPS